MFRGVKKGRKPLMDKGSTAERLPQSDRWKLSTGPLWDPFRITVQGITTRRVIHCSPACTRTSTSWLRSGMAKRCLAMAVVPKS